MARFGIDTTMAEPSTAMPKRSRAEAEDPRQGPASVLSKSETLTQGVVCTPDRFSFLRRCNAMLFGWGCGRLRAWRHPRKSQAGGV